MWGDTDRSGRRGDRGQAHTLEAIVAGMVLLSSLVFALQVTAVTPLSASTASQHIENQQQSMADGVLGISSETSVPVTQDSALKQAVLYWNTSSSGFHDAERGYYVNDPPPIAFGDTLDHAFAGRAIAYNVNVVFLNEDGDWVTRRLVFRGEPSDHAVTASHRVTLNDGDQIYNADGDPTGTTVSSTGDFYAPDVSSPTNNAFYNIVRVEVVVWRM